MLLVEHIDEIEDNNPSEIPDAKLPSDRSSCFKIRF